jgi:hypothetical protein
MGSVASTVSSVVESVGNAASNVAETVGDVASDAAQVVSNVADKADNFVQGGAWDPGGVFYSVGDAVSSVGKPIGDAFQTVGQVAGDTAKAVGSAGADLDKVVNREIPGGWITVGLVAGTIATAGALGAGATAAEGATAASAASAAEAGAAATTFAGASSTTAASVAGNILQGAATGALKGAAVGGIMSVLEGDSILEGAMSGGASGALGGAVLGMNQTLDFNPFVERAMGSMAKAAASPRGLEKSLDKIAFNTAAGYLGNEIGIPASAAVPLATVAKAAAEGKDVSELIKKQALSYAVGQAAGPVKDALGNVASEIKDAVGFDSGSGGEEAPEDQTAMDKALNFAQNATEKAVEGYLKNEINKPPARPTTPTTPRMSAQELMNQGYSWDADRKVWKRPTQQTQAAPTPIVASMPSNGAPNPFQYADTASDLSNEVTPDQYTEMKYNALNDYVDPYASLENKNATLSGSTNINDIGFDYNEPNTQYQIDKSMGAYVDPQEVMGEYVDPMLKKSKTNLMASGLPVQAGFAEGGTTGKDKETENNEFIDKATENVFRYIRPGVTHGNANYNLPGYPFGQLYRIGMADGGAVEGHNPQFFSEGGLNSLGNTYVKGDGDGTSDSIPAMLANGEFVIPADIVSGLGNGSNDSGAKVLDEFLKTIRKHKQKTGADKLPPDSKGPLGYLLEAKRKMKA